MKEPTTLPETAARQQAQEAVAEAQRAVERLHARMNDLDVEIGQHLTAAEAGEVIDHQRGMAAVSERHYIDVQIQGAETRLANARSVVAELAVPEARARLAAELRPLDAEAEALSAEVKVAVDDLAGKLEALANMRNAVLGSICTALRAHAPDVSPVVLHDEALQVSGQAGHIFIDGEWHKRQDDVPLAARRWLADAANGREDAHRHLAETTSTISQRQFSYAK